MERESTPAGEIRADGMVVHHHRERTMHSDVRVHQALELLRVVVSFVSRDYESSAGTTTVLTCQSETSPSASSGYGRRYVSGTVRWAGAKEKVTTPIIRVHDRCPMVLYRSTKEGVLCTCAEPVKICKSYVLCTPGRPRLTGCC